MAGRSIPDLDVGMQQNVVVLALVVHYRREWAIYPFGLKREPVPSETIGRETQRLGSRVRDWKRAATWGTNGEKTRARNTVCG